MRSPAVRGAGNKKLRGKKTMMIACGCCEAINFKDFYNEVLANKEILEYNSELQRNSGETVATRDC